MFLISVTLKRQSRPKPSSRVELAAMARSSPMMRIFPESKDKIRLLSWHKRRQNDGNNIYRNEQLTSRVVLVLLAPLQINLTNEDWI